ncbi:hypothetical protein HYPSUDRAFT_67630 [Hypholoma sublateritium FD-334 SS-4]|uniref:F-box domain-containing protein n=1 Tax=Hypholoma sublateritium (strain FD-334 SS-4) TaxID=945553 RepID=A0A0D2MDW0_HYPSF|nr:hypothetical protein HYPSUDRAFT_67630 [Hypholoma sublateritium FD-334 SS-4]
MGSQSILPLDTLADVADALASEQPKDNATLRMLSQACKLMVPICRRHLFSSITLVPTTESMTEAGDYSERVQGLSKLFETDPSIPYYVRALTYEVTTSADEYEQRMIRALKTHATSMRSIDLKSKAWVDWNALPKLIKTSLVSLMQLPTIALLKYELLQNFPSHELVRCGLISINDLKKPKPEPKEGNYISVSIERGGLELQAPPESPLEDMRAREPISDYSSVREAFFLITSADEARQMADHLQTVTQLESLNVTVYAPVQLEGLGASLAAAARSTLTSATFTMVVGAGDYGPWCGLDRELREISGDNNLGDVQLRVKVQTDQGCNTSSDDWSSLDALLANPCAFPALRSGCFELACPSTHITEAELDNLMMSFATNTLPRLLRYKPTLKFNLRVKH